MNQPTVPAKPTTPPPAPAPAKPPEFPPAPEGMMNVVVDGLHLIIKKGSTVMDACTIAEKEIPHFCYHKRLSIAGNCRMCLVEIEGMPKPVASCHWPAGEGMKIRTDSKTATEARKGTMEFLLINHPLDCPICDQGGECTLQDLSVGYGGDRTHYHEDKRAVDDKNIGAKIKTVMTRCIHCTRCIRFATEIAGVEEMGATGRGEHMEVGTYVEQALQSELAGNMIDLCPVGALTNKPYAFTARPWELVNTDSIDVLDAVGGHLVVDQRAGQVMRIRPRECDAVNEEWCTDAARFSYDALNTNRLSAPLVKGTRTGWSEAFAAMKKILKGVRKNRIAGLMDASMHGAEDAYAFHQFMTDTLGTEHVDSRPAGSQATTTRALNISHVLLKDMEQADAVVLIGCNPRLEAPLLNVRLRRLATKKRVPIYSIGSAMDLTYPFKNFGEHPARIEELMTAKDSPLKGKERVLVIAGGSVWQREDARAVVNVSMQLAGKFSKVQWNGFAMLHDSCGTITALDMGVVPAKGGKDTAGILAAWQEGALDVLVVYGQAELTAKQLKKGKGTLVYIGTHHDEIAELADIVLPVAAWAEKKSLHANLEGRVQEARAAVMPPLLAKEDWKVFRALSAELEEPLPFDNLSQLRALISKRCKAYGNIGIVTPEAYKVPAKSGKLGKEPLEALSQPYYMRTAYLKHSANMARMQAEVGSAKVRGVK